MRDRPVDIARQHQLVSFAQAALARGEIELAERLCREMNAVGWGDWRTWALIAEVAAGLGRADIRSDAIERARAGGANGAEMARLSGLAVRPPEAPVVGGLHVIRAWGQGFWSDVDHVIGQLLVAEIAGRMPLVLWGANSRFRDGAECNGWELYFDPVSEARWIDIERGGESFFPAKWTETNLTVAENGAFLGPGSRIAALPFFARSEAVTVSDFHAPAIAVAHWLPESHPLAGKDVENIYLGTLAAHVRVRPEIRAIASDTAARLGIGRDGPVIAVHVRGSDKAIEMGDMRPVHAAYHGEIERLGRVLGGLARVLLLTDWEPAAAEYRARYGDRLLESRAMRTGGNVGLHFQKGLDGHALGREVLIDTLLGASCEAIVGMAYSNVSLFMSYFARLRGLPAERIALLGPNQHHNYNSFLLRK